MSSPSLIEQSWFRLAWWNRASLPGGSSLGGPPSSSVGHHLRRPSPAGWSSPCFHPGSFGYPCSAFDGWPGHVSKDPLWSLFHTYCRGSVPGWHTWRSPWRALAEIVSLSSMGALGGHSLAMKLYISCWFSCLVQLPCQIHYWRTRDQWNCNIRKSWNRGGVKS